MKKAQYSFEKFLINACDEKISAQVVLTENNGSSHTRISEEMSGSNFTDAILKCINNVTGLSLTIISHRVVCGRAVVWVDYKGKMCKGVCDDKIELRASAKAYIHAINESL
ncbi:MAG: hypothetical protein ABIA02_03620 [Candidatus Falkowbacteria bacterium]